MLRVERSRCVCVSSCRAQCTSPANSYLDTVSAAQCGPNSEFSAVHTRVAERNVQCTCVCNDLLCRTLAVVHVGTGSTAQQYTVQYSPTQHVQVTCNRSTTHPPHRAHYCRTTTYIPLALTLQSARPPHLETRHHTTTLQCLLPDELLTTTSFSSPSACGHTTLVSMFRSVHQFLARHNDACFVSHTLLV